MKTTRVKCRRELRGEVGWLQSKCVSRGRGNGGDVNAAQCFSLRSSLVGSRFKIMACLTMACHHTRDVDVGRTAKVPCTPTNIGGARARFPICVLDQ